MATAPSASGRAAQNALEAARAGVRLIEPRRPPGGVQPGRTVERDGPIPESSPSTAYGSACSGRARL
jgi:hypothetical protein